MSIYFEKQEAALCGVHCVNNLLQSSYFTEVEFAELAQQLDAMEAAQLGHPQSQSGSAPYKSERVSASGFFNLEVLQSALQVFNLVLLPYMSEEASEARQHPERECAYVCNYQEHWFPIRRFGNDADVNKHLFYNLNSLYDSPEVVSPTLLKMTLHQLQLEQYSIFIVRGTLPQCAGDAVINLNQTRQQQQNDEDDDDDLQRAIEFSLGSASAGTAGEGKSHSAKEEDLDMEAAIALSNETHSSSVNVNVGDEDKKEEEEEDVVTMRERALAAALKRMENNGSGNSNVE